MGVAVKSPPIFPVLTWGYKSIHIADGIFWHIPGSLNSRFYFSSIDQLILPPMRPHDIPRIGKAGLFERAIAAQICAIDVCRNIPFMSMIKVERGGKME